MTLDPRLSNTASMSDVWLPTWPGSEQSVLLAVANYLIQNDRYNKEFVRRWVNWKETLAAVEAGELAVDFSVSKDADGNYPFAEFERLLKVLYAEFTLERGS